MIHEFVEGKHIGLETVQMPKPQFMYLEDPDTIGSEKILRIKSIGMRAFAPDGTIKTFRWHINLPFGDLGNKYVRHDTAAIVALIKLRTEADAAIGPAVDNWENDDKTGRVNTFSNKPRLYGLYIESNKKPDSVEIWNIRHIVKSDIVFSSRKPKDIYEAIDVVKRRRGKYYKNFVKMLEKASAVLPNPNYPKPLQPA